VPVPAPATIAKSLEDIIYQLLYRVCGNEINKKRSRIDE
jgi:hypothetical protein